MFFKPFYINIKIAYTLFSRHISVFDDILIVDINTMI